MKKIRALGWNFWGAVVAVAFPGPYGPGTGYDPRDSDAGGQHGHYPFAYSRGPRLSGHSGHVGEAGPAEVWWETPSTRV